MIPAPPAFIRSVTFPFVCTLAAFLCGLPSLARSADADSVKPSAFPGAATEVYKKASGSELRIHRFDPPGHDPAKDRRPAVVFFFGGGWKGGSPSQFEPHARYFAGRGLVTFLADYRVESRQGTTPRECVADGKSAVRWIRRHAERLGVDPDRIAAGGGSAGGHVAATTGICEGLDDPGDDLSVSSKSQLLLLFNPVYDNGPGGYGHDRAKEWFPAISPAHNLGADDPPAIVFLGTRDKLIPVATAKRFRDRQKELGVDSELHLYEGEPHGFFNLKQSKPDNFLDTVRKADAFLVKHGYLEGSVDEPLLKRIAGKRKVPGKAKRKNKGEATTK